eukprot:m.220270 g.220270  ORF g.220270 m.220270 type:complete len:738 (-) comp13829_c6_seq1:179-2392(-)
MVENSKAVHHIDDVEQAKGETKPRTTSLMVVHEPVVSDSSFTHQPQHSTLNSVMGMLGRDRRRSSAMMINDGGEVRSEMEFCAFNLCDSARDFLSANDMPNLCLAIEDQSNSNNAGVANVSIKEERSLSSPTSTTLTKKLSAQGVTNVEVADMHAFTRLTYPSKCKKCDRACFFHAVICNKCNKCYHTACVENLGVADICTVPESNIHRQMSVFGSSIQSQCTEKVDGVPIIIRRIAECLERNAMDFEGLYRLSGVKSRVEMVCASFEDNPRTVSVEDESPIVLAAVLKLYLRQLTEPLFSPDVVEKCLEIGRWRIKNYKDEDCVQTTSLRLAELVDSLDHVNYNTAAFLCAHLLRVSYHAEQNKMAPKNLAIVFGPTLLPSSVDSLEHLMQMPVQSAVVEIMIKHCEDVFITYFEQRPAQRPSTCEKLLMEGGGVDQRSSLRARGRSHRYSASMMHANRDKTPKSEHEQLIDAEAEDDSSSSEEELELGFPNESNSSMSVIGGSDDDVIVEHNNKLNTTTTTTTMSTTATTAATTNSSTAVISTSTPAKKQSPPPRPPSPKTSPLTRRKNNSIPERSPQLRKKSGRNKNRISGKVYSREEMGKKVEKPSQPERKEETKEKINDSADRPDSKSNSASSRLLTSTLSMDEPSSPPPEPQCDDDMNSSAETNLHTHNSDSSLSEHRNRSRYSSYGTLPDTPPPPPPEEEDNDDEDEEGNDSLDDNADRFMGDFTKEEFV